MKVLITSLTLCMLVACISKNEPMMEMPEPVSIETAPPSGIQKVICIPTGGYTESNGAEAVIYQIYHREVIGEAQTYWSQNLFKSVFTSDSTKRISLQLANQDTLQNGKVRRNFSILKDIFWRQEVVTEILDTAGNVIGSRTCYKENGFTQCEQDWK